MRRVMWVPVAAILAVLAATSPADAQTPVDRTVATPATGGVQIENLAGAVHVVGWDRAEVRVTGTLGEGTERLDVEARGSDVRIAVVVPRNARSVGDSELEIRVPTRKDVRVKTTSAEISLEGLTGLVDAQSVSGDVQIAGSPASVRAVSTSGEVTVGATTSRVEANSTSGTVRISGTVRESVEASAVSGDVDVLAAVPEVMVKSVSGQITVSNASRRLAANTVSGSIRVSGGPLQYAAMESVSGDVAFDARLTRDAAINAQSHSGSITMVLPAGLEARFQATTFSGDIQNDFGPSARPVSQYAPGRELDFTTGGGGALVSAKSFSGRIRFQRAN